MGFNHITSATGNVRPVNGDATDTNTASLPITNVHQSDEMPSSGLTTQQALNAIHTTDPIPSNPDSSSVPTWSEIANPSSANTSPSLRAEVSEDVSEAVSTQSQGQPTQQASGVSWGYYGEYTEESDGEYSDDGEDNEYVQKHARVGRSLLKADDTTQCKPQPGDIIINENLTIPFGEVILDSPYTAEKALRKCLSLAADYRFGTNPSEIRGKICASYFAGIQNSSDVVLEVVEAIKNFAHNNTEDLNFSTVRSWENLSSISLNQTFNLIDTSKFITTSQVNINCSTNCTAGTQSAINNCSDKTNSSSINKENISLCSIVLNDQSYQELLKTLGVEQQSSWSWEAFKEACAFAFDELREFLDKYFAGYPVMNVFLIGLGSGIALLLVCGVPFLVCQSRSHEQSILKAQKKPIPKKTSLWQRMRKKNFEGQDYEKLKEEILGRNANARTNGEGRPLLNQNAAGAEAAANTEAPKDEAKEKGKDKDQADKKENKVSASAKVAERAALLREKKAAYVEGMLQQGVFIPATDSDIEQSDDEEIPDDEIPNLQRMLLVKKGQLEQLKVDPARTRRKINKLKTEIRDLEEEIEEKLTTVDPLVLKKIRQKVEKDQRKAKVKAHKEEKQSKKTEKEEEKEAKKQAKIAAREGRVNVDRSFLDDLKDPTKFTKLQFYSRYEDKPDYEGHEHVRAQDQRRAARKEKINQERLERIKSYKADAHQEQEERKQRKRELIARLRDHALTDGNNELAETLEEFSESTLYASVDEPKVEMPQGIEMRTWDSSQPPPYSFGDARHQIDKPKDTMAEAYAAARPEFLRRSVGLQKQKLEASQRRAEALLAQYHDIAYQEPARDAAPSKKVLLQLNTALKQGGEIEASSALLEKQKEELAETVQLILAEQLPEVFSTSFAAQLKAKKVTQVVKREIERSQHDAGRVTIPSFQLSRIERVAYIQSLLPDVVAGVRAHYGQSPFISQIERIVAQLDQLASELSRGRVLHRTDMVLMQAEADIAMSGELDSLITSIISLIDEESLNQQITYLSSAQVRGLAGNSFNILLEEAKRIKSENAEQERQDLLTPQAAIMQRSLTEQATEVSSFSFTDRQQADLVSDIVLMLNQAASDFTHNRSENDDERDKQVRTRSMLRGAIGNVANRQHELSKLNALRDRLLSLAGSQVTLTSAEHYTVTHTLKIKCKLSLEPHQYMDILGKLEPLCKPLMTEEEEIQEVLQALEEIEQKEKGSRVSQEQITSLSLNIISETAKRLTAAALHKLQVTVPESLLAILTQQIKQKLSLALHENQLERLRVIEQRQSAERERKNLRHVDETSDSDLQKAKQLLEHAKLLREEAASKLGEIEELAETADSAGAGVNFYQISFAKDKERKNN